MYIHTQYIQKLTETKILWLKNCPNGSHRFYFFKKVLKRLNFVYLGLGERWRVEGGSYGEGGG